MALRPSTRPKWRWWPPPTQTPRRCGSPNAWPNSATTCKRRRRRHDLHPHGEERILRVSNHEATLEPLAILRDARKRAPQDEVSVQRIRSITPRGGDGVHAVVAEHMGHEARLEYLCEGRVADAEAAGIGAECRHHRALAIAGKAAPFHRAAAGGERRSDRSRPRSPPRRPNLSAMPGRDCRRSRSSRAGPAAP